MNKDLLKVSIRQNAIYLPLIEEEKKQEELTSTTIALVAQLRKVESAGTLAGQGAECFFL